MTSKAVFELNADLRQDQGKGASRRLRRLQDQVPAIIYGGDEPPQLVSLDQKKVMHALEHDAFFSHILTLHVAGKKQQVVLKDVQRHPFKKALLHMDFFRVKATDYITMRVPLHFVGENKAPGVKAKGIVSHRLIDIEVRCKANVLPEFIEVDISKMELDETIHLSQLKIPAGIELMAFGHGHDSEHDYAVVSIHLPRILEESPDAAEAGPVTEVIPKGKEAAAETTPGTTKAALSASGTATTAKPSKSKDSK
jgi:large subunit ribosomal protein L25